MRQGKNKINKPLSFAHCSPQSNLLSDMDFPTLWIYNLKRVEILSWKKPPLASTRGWRYLVQQASFPRQPGRFLPLSRSGIVGVPAASCPAEARRPGKAAPQSPGGASLPLQPFQRAGVPEIALPLVPAAPALPAPSL